MPSGSETLTARIDRGEPAYGLIVKMPNQPVVEMAGYAGFDLVVIDTEHGMADDSALENHLRSARLAGIAALVRVGQNDPAAILRALDAGATGVIIPHITSRADAEKAVRAAFYPPRGSRGLAVSTIAGKYGAVSLPDHLDSAEGTIVLAQAEDEHSATHIGDITSVAGLTGVWIGLADLSISLGHPGQSHHPAVAAAIETIVTATRRAGRLLCVIADDPEDAQNWLDRGARVVLFNSTTLISAAFGAALAHRPAPSQHPVSSDHA